MTSFQDRLNEALSKRNMKPSELSKLSGVNEGAISQYRKGKYKATQYNLEKMAKVLQVSIPWLMGADVDESLPIPQASNIHPLKPIKVPILGKIACGKPIFETEDFQGFVSFISKAKVDFCLIAQGDSMTGARINNGDVVFICQQPEVENGEIAAVSINEEVTLKRVYIKEHQIVLAAENPKYEPMIYNLNEIESFRILGKAVAFQSKII